MTAYSLSAIFGSADHLRVTQFKPGGKRGWREREVHGKWRAKHRELAAKLRLPLWTEALENEMYETGDSRDAIGPCDFPYWRLHAESFGTKKSKKLLPIGIKPALDLGFVSDEYSWKQVSAKPTTLEVMRAEILRHCREEFSGFSDLNAADVELLLRDVVTSIDRCVEEMGDARRAVLQTRP